MTTDYATLAAYKAASKVLGWIDGTMPLDLQTLADALDHEVHRLNAEQLDLLRRFLKRLPSFCRTPKERHRGLVLVFGLLASENGWAHRFPADLLDDVLAWAETDERLDLPSRAAYGLVTRRQEDHFRRAIRAGRLSRQDLLSCAFDGEALSRRLSGFEDAAPLHFATVDLSGMPMAGSQAPSWVGEPVEQRTSSGATFQMLISTEAELDQLVWLEPTTMSWLDRTLEDDSVLFDVGANIGYYSLYALHTRPSCKVVAFEPAPMNFHRLLLNFELNGLSAASVFPFALSNRECLSTFGYQSLAPGASSQTGAHAGGVSGGVVSGTYTLTLDGVVEKSGDVPAPTHLKLDVDGHEPKILEGAAGCLSNPKLEHLAIETTAEGLGTLEKDLSKLGFRMVEPFVRGFGNAFFHRPREHRRAEPEGKP